MKSARELKSALLAVGTGAEEAEAIVQKGIAEGKLDNDIEVKAVPDELFERALAAIDSVFAGQSVVAKSEAEVAAAKVEAAVASGGSVDHAAMLSAEIAGLRNDISATNAVVKSCMRAIKDMFVSVVTGINESSKVSSTSIAELSAAVSDVRKSVTAPKGVRSAPAPQLPFGAQDVEPDYITAKRRLVEVMKAESARTDTPAERRRRLSNGFLCLSAANDINTVRRVASDLGITLD